MHRKYHNVTAVNLSDHLWLLRTLNTLQETVISRLLLVVVIKKQSRALTREDTRDPRVLVRDTPNSHTNALLDSKASAGEVLPNCGLRGNLRVADGGGV
jgi:hypothetical protein